MERGRNSPAGCDNLPYITLLWLLSSYSSAVRLLLYLNNILVVLRQTSMSLSGFFPPDIIPVGRQISEIFFTWRQTFIKYTYYIHTHTQGNETDQGNVYNAASPMRRVKQSRHYVQTITIYCHRTNRHAWPFSFTVRTRNC